MWFPVGNFLLKFTSCAHKKKQAVSAVIFLALALKTSTLVFTLSLTWWKQKGTVKGNIDKKGSFFPFFLKN